MPKRQILLVALLTVCSWPVVVLRGEEEPDASTKWVCVYGWVQIGERLADADQWPLAMGSYIEAHRQLADLAEQHPDFEPEMVSYRKEWLDTEIEKTKERLHTGEHDVMMKYLDFIETFELGQSQRFNNDYQSAISTLDIAKSLLDEIIEVKPGEFREAVSSQYDLLLDSIIWLNSQIDFAERSRPATFVNDSDDWGTTEFVKETDLPAEKGAVPMSGDLFPERLMAALASEFDLEEVVAPRSQIPSVGIRKPSEPIGGETPVKNPESNLPGFRMSSKKPIGNASDE
tara:strand:+ start:644 stop:1504 length:861 start_codon:yes stop_codon:yes gene_type:complete